MNFAFNPISHRTLEAVVGPIINGYFFASVFSPTLFDKEEYDKKGNSKTHAVVIDKKFNIIHDPNKNNINVKKYPLSDEIKYNGIVRVFVFEKYEELDFSKLNLCKKEDFNKNTWIALNDFEINKIKKVLSNDEYYDIVKLEDDYYIIVILYNKVEYYIKCDQLSELLKVLKYIKKFL